MTITEKRIQFAIYYNWLGVVYMVPNIHLFLGEADMFLVRPSGYAEEFEVKCTLADYNADFKKCRKHSKLKILEEHGGDKPIRIPNRFSYVVPAGLITSVPSYAGLFWYADGRLRCKKYPPLLHKGKWNWDAQIARSFSHRHARLFFAELRKEKGWT